jgi:hypothetical protein
MKNALCCSEGNQREIDIHSDNRFKIEKVKSVLNMAKNLSNGR